jgi:hypothetical protein
MDDLIRILDSRGPLTGKELLKETGSDEFSLWAACSRSEAVITKIIGRRYLRLDQQVEEYARLSPSIMREFYSYTVVGTAQYEQEILQKAELLRQEIVETSKKKLHLAQKTIAGLVEAHRDCAIIKKCACFLIAGDVVYQMAHGEPRPETSTGEMVRGSDLDIIVVVEDLPEAVIGTLDAAIYDEKYRLLMSPAHREEIDYIVKDMARVREQLQFKDFKSMVAAKILDEAEYLYGSPDLFHRLKRMLQEQGIPGRLQALEQKAFLDRKNAEDYLLSKARDNLTEEESMKLFYTAEEKEEIF